MRYSNKYTPLGVRQKMIMHCFWDYGECMTKNEVAEALKDKYEIPLSPNATSAMIKTLINRGYVEKMEKRGASYLYRPTISKEEFMMQELKWMNGSDFGGSAVAMWTGVLNATIDDDDFEEAMEMILRSRK